MRLGLRDIHKSFGGVQALRGASLEASAGEIHALCGENGAGKSTLLKVLSGVHPHGSFLGELIVEGRARRFASPAAARDAGIAMVHQELMLVPELSVADNLFLGREPGRAGFIDDLALRADARALLARYHLDREIDAERPVGELGIGLCQMVEIVRALAQDARILILDEPTAALTPDEAARLHQWLRELRAAGTTCLYVSHRMDEIFALTDRITVLRDGATAGVLITSAATPDQVVSLMVGRTLTAAIRHTPNSAIAQATAPAALDVRALTMTGALDAVSFALKPGEILGIAGAMGSGRTALLSALFGCARAPVTGEIRIAGDPVRLRHPIDAIRHGLALVPEDRKALGLVLSLSAAENLALPSLALPTRSPALPTRSPGSSASSASPASPVSPASPSPSVIASWWARLAARIGFVDDLALLAEAEARMKSLRVRGLPGDEAATLSGGNQQKLVLGKWLSAPPRVLLLDEPTRGVDVGAREEIHALLDALRARGTAIVVASSDLGELLRLSDRIVVLRRGRIVGELAAAEASEAAIVALSSGATPGTAGSASGASGTGGTLAGTGASPPGDSRSGEHACA